MAESCGSCVQEFMFWYTQSKYTHYIQLISLVKTIIINISFVVDLVVSVVTTDNSKQKEEIGLGFPWIICVWTHFLEPVWILVLTGVSSTNISSARPILEFDSLLLDLNW